MNFRKEFEKEQKIVRNLLGLYAPRLWEYIDEDDFIMRDNIDEIRESIIESILVAHPKEEPIEYLKNNDPTLTRGFSLANGIWDVSELDCSLLASLVFQDDLTSEMNDLLPKLEKKLF